MLIDQRHTTDNRQHIIVGAKARSRRIDVTHVEAFLSLMADVEATHGYLVPSFAHMASRRRPNAARNRPFQFACCHLIVWRTSTHRSGQDVVTAAFSGTAIRL